MWLALPTVFVITGAITTKKNNLHTNTNYSSNHMGCISTAIQTLNCFCTPFSSGTNYTQHTHTCPYTYVVCNHIYPRQNGFRVSCSVLRLLFSPKFPLVSFFKYMHSKSLTDEHLCISYIPKRTGNRAVK